MRALLLFLVVLSVQAQDFPQRGPIEITVLFPAGSSADVTARLLADGMRKHLNQQVLVVNRPGAGGAIGYRYVAAQKPDGYSLVWNSNSISTAYHSGQLPFDYKTFDPVARVLRSGGIFLSYVPTIIQSHQLTETLRRHPGYTLIETFETLFRPWNIENTSVRPFHRMVAHTGFITVARRVVPGLGAVTSTCLPLSHWLRSLAKASAVGYRSAGSFASALRQMFSIPLSRPSALPASTIWSGGMTGSFTTFIRISIGDSPVNGVRPVMHSYRITPSE